MRVPEPHKKLRTLRLTFSHPDYTVGSGLAAFRPLNRINPRFTRARGLDTF